MAKGEVLSRKDTVTEDSDEEILDGPEALLIAAEEACVGGVCTLPATQHLQVRVNISVLILKDSWIYYTVNDYRTIIRRSFVIFVYRRILIEIKGHSLRCYMKVLLVLSESSCIQKVIYTKYYNNWPYTVAHTIDCVCSKYK